MVCNQRHAFADICMLANSREELAYSDGPQRRPGNVRTWGIVHTWQSNEQWWCKGDYFWRKRNMKILVEEKGQWIGIWGRGDRPAVKEAREKN